jgi:polygalacturonase
MLEGFTIKNSPSWCIHPVYCENLIIRKLRVLTWEAPNGDGIDPDSCKNVLIENCFFHTGDDCVVLKAGRDEEAWQIGIPCENIVVRHCYMKTGLSGLAIGSEMSAGVRNVYFHDCHCESTKSGIGIKSHRGRGGVVENIWIENIHIGKRPASDESADSIAAMKKPSCAIYIILDCPGSSASEIPPVFRNIHLSSITSCDYPHALIIRGLPESPIENIRFQNVKLAAASEGLVINCAKGVVFEDFSVRPERP